MAWRHVRRRWSDRVKVVQENLFPEYVFCRSTFADRISVLSQPGVEAVVGYDRKPTMVPDEQIVFVRRLLASGLPLGQWSFLESGQRVRIVRGEFAGLEGTLVPDSSPGRVVVNVEALQLSVAVEVERDQICLLSESAA